MTVFVYLLAVLGILTVNVLLDRYQFKRGMVINHSLEAFFRGMLLVAFALYFASGFWQFAALLLYSASLYWLVFDWAVNRFILDMPDNYVGKTAKIDRWFRRNYRDNFENTMLAYKCILMVIANAVIIIVF